MNLSTRNKHRISFFHFDFCFINSANSFSGEDVDNLFSVFMNMLLMR